MTYISLRNGLLDIVSELEEGLEQPTEPLKMEILRKLLNRLIDLAVKASDQMQEYYRARANGETFHSRSGIV